MARHSAYASLAQLLMKFKADGTTDTTTDTSLKAGKPVLMAFGSAFTGRKRSRGSKHGSPIKGIRRALARVGPVVDGPEFWSSACCSLCGRFVTHPEHQKAVCSFCKAHTPRDESAASNILQTTLYQLFFRMRVPTMTPDLQHTKWKYFVDG